MFLCKLEWGREVLLKSVSWTWRMSSDYSYLVQNQSAVEPWRIYVLKRHETGEILRLDARHVVCGTLLFGCQEQKFTYASLIVVVLDLITSCLFAGMNEGPMFDARCSGRMGHGTTRAKGSEFVPTTSDDGIVSFINARYISLLYQVYIEIDLLDSAHYFLLSFLLHIERGIAP